MSLAASAQFPVRQWYVSSQNARWCRARREINPALSIFGVFKRKQADFRYNEARRDSSGAVFS
jgi:hypothetical protein